jgi:hypothetical protein
LSADIWGVFHDGSIEAPGRPAPSVVQVRSSLLYLREMFAGAGDAFLVALHGCSCFRYRPFEGEPLDDLSAIALAALEILSVHRRPQLVLLCSAGEIDLAYDAMAVAPDPGKPVSEEQLIQAAQRYWDGSEAKHRRRSEYARPFYGAPSRCGAACRGSQDIGSEWG